MFIIEHMFNNFFSGLEIFFWEPGTAFLQINYL